MKTKILAGRRRRPGEEVIQHVCSLRQLVTTFDFGSREDSILRDKVLKWLDHRRIREGFFPLIDEQKSNDYKDTADNSVSLEAVNSQEILKNYVRIKLSNRNSGVPPGVALHMPKR